MSIEAPTGLTIDIVSDVMCPWCLIGKRRIERAMDIAGLGGRVQMRWHPFQLDATLPATGKDRRLYLEEKFGGPERADAIYARIADEGRKEGIDFAFDRIEVAANTFDAHRLIALSARYGPHIHNGVVEALFAAYFLEGRNIGDPDTLCDIAVQAGLDRQEVAAMLAGDGLADTVRAGLEQAGRIGVTGVPFFILAGRHGLAGAQPAEVMADAMRQAVN